MEAVPDHQSCSTAQQLWFVAKRADDAAEGAGRPNWRRSSGGMLGNSAATDNCDDPLTVEPDDSRHAGEPVHDGAEAWRVHPRANIT